MRMRICVHEFSQILTHKFEHKLSFSQVNKTVISPGMRQCPSKFCLHDGSLEDYYVWGQQDLKLDKTLHLYTISAVISQFPSSLDHYYVSGCLSQLLFVRNVYYTRVQTT